MKDNVIPAFRRGYRMQWEAAQDSHVVLYPEGMAKLNETAVAILELVDGKQDVAAIVATLDARFSGRGRCRRRRQRVPAIRHRTKMDTVS